MADTHGKKIMAIRAAVLIGITYILTGMVTDQWQLFLTRALMGFANGFMPAAMTMVSLSVPQEKAGTALGIFQTGLIVGNVIGPSLGGMVESVIGMRPVFYVAGIVLFVAAAVVYFFVKEPHVAMSEGERQQAKKTSLRDDWRIVRSKEVLTDCMKIFVLTRAILVLQPILALYIGRGGRYYGKGPPCCQYDFKYRRYGRRSNDEFVGVLRTAEGIL